MYLLQKSEPDRQKSYLIDWQIILYVAIRCEYYAEIATQYSIIYNINIILLLHFK